MRLMHFISAPAAGGAEVYVKDLCKALRREGHDLHVVFLSRAIEVGRDPEFERLYLKELLDAGIGFTFMPEGARRKPFLSVLQLRKIVNGFSPEILHCHLYYALVFSFFLSGTPVVYTHHNIALKVPKILYRIFDSRVSAYVGISLVCSSLLKSVSRCMVRRIDNGIDPARILPRQVSQNQVPKIVMVGSLCKQKNYDLFLEAVALLNELDFTVCIAGEGDQKDRLISKAKELGLNDKVSFLGNISNVNQLLSEADVFAMSSSWEGLPISLLEGTASGLPSVVTNVGGCSEVIHYCQSGVVVDELQPKSYALALKSLIESSQSRDFYGKNALRYWPKYSIQCSADEHLSLYGELLA